MSLQPSTACSLILAAFTGVALTVACATPLPESCEALADEPEAEATSTTIEIRNVGAVPIFLPEFNGHDLFVLEVDGVGVVDDPAFPNMYCATIEEAPDDECAEEPLTKDSDRVVRLEPGASLELAWDAYVWDTVEIDDACFGGPLCAYGMTAYCHAGRVVETGSMLRIRTLPAASCSFEAGECTCPQGEAACEIPFEPDGFDQAMLAEPLAEVELEFEFTGDPIVIEVGG